MRALVVSNCATQTYVETLQQLFPDWEVRGAAVDYAAAWIADGSKPEFEAYLRICDLYVGYPLEQQSLASILNPAADRIILPALIFKGLHPDWCVLPGFRHPATGRVTDAQRSLIAVAARSLGMDVAQAAALFCAETYEAFDFFDRFETEKRRMLDDFQRYDLDISREFERWEMIGAFYHVPHHPRPVVMVDVLRRALYGCYLDQHGFAASAALWERMPDRLEVMQGWPVYPEIAARHGFRGSLIWRRPSEMLTHEPAGPNFKQWSLEEYLRATFDALSVTDTWRDVSFVTGAAAVLRMLGRTRGSTGSGENHPHAASVSDPFSSLGENERLLVEAALAAPGDAAALSRACHALLRVGTVDALDALYARAAAIVRFDHGVMNLWTVASLNRRDWSEVQARAQAMIDAHPWTIQGRALMLRALVHTGGYDDAMHRAESWMKEWPAAPPLIATSLEIATMATDWPLAERLSRELERTEIGAFNALQRRFLVLALRGQGKQGESEQALAEARDLYPGNSWLESL